MFAVALLIAAAAPAPPQTAADEQGFVSGLESVDLQMQRRRWAKARTDLDELLLGHRGRDYVLARDLQVREVMKRIAFHIETPEPDLGKIFPGELGRYKDGKLQAVFRFAEGLGEFEYDEGARRLMLPMRFAGPVDLRFEGRSYPSDMALQLIVEQEEAAYRLLFGVDKLMGSTNYYPAYIFLIDGEDDVELDVNKQPNLTASGDFEVDVDISGSKFAVKTNGKKMVDAKREKGAPGRVYLLGLKSDALPYLTLTVDGEVETSWIDNMIDRELEGKRAAFEQRYDPAKYLPEWFLEGEVVEVEAEEEPAAERSGSLRERAAGSAKPAAPAGLEPNFRAFPGRDLGRREAEAMFDAFQGLQERYTEPLAAQLAFLEGLRAEDALPAVFLDFLGFRLCERAGLDQQAADYAREVVKVDPAHVETRIGYAGALSRLKDPRAAGVWRAVVDDFPGDAAIVHEVAIHYMLDNRLDEADKLVTEQAKDADLREELQSLRRMLVHARSGPSWGRRYAHESRYYEVASDLDEEICEAAAAVLESAYKSYSLHLKKVDGLEGRRFRVYLFSGEEGYKRYASEAFGGGEPESTAGLYSGLVKQLLIWSLPDREQMFRTILHEGFHQYLDQVMPDPPVWLNEGMAEYFELQQTEAGKWREGQPHAYNLSVLEQDPLIPLAEYVRLDHASFRDPEHTARNYAQGWAFVHFLRNSTRENARFFDTMFETFCARGGRQAVVEEVFADFDFAAMDAALAAHVAALRGQ